MKSLAFLALFTAPLIGAGCGTSSSQGGSSETPPPTVTTTPEATTAPTATAETPKPEEKPEAKPEETPKPETTGGDKPGGRLAFIACTPEARAAKGCTKELKPVCGQVDTGIRCIKAPCPSTEQRTFPNACTACSEPKVQGYFARSCEDIQSGAAP